ncbi:MAG: stage III sporulation protein AE [Clostridia bacterium]|nr:stage III sporulation protein AE [Clostridia bacterium]
MKNSSGKTNTVRRRSFRGTYVVLLVVLLAVLIFCFLVDFENVAYADSGKQTKESVDADLSKAIEEVIARLNINSIQNFIDSLGGEEAEFLSVGNVRETIKALTSGESGNFFERLFSLLGSTVGRYFLAFLPSFITILIICVLKSMLTGLTANFLDNSTTEVVHVVVYAGVIGILMTGVIKILSSVVGVINSLSKFAEAVFPVLLTLLSAVGGTTTVAAYTPMLAVLSGGIMSIITKIIVPSFIAVVVFSVVGNLSKTVKLEKLTHLIKTASTWLIGVVFGLFATFLAAQGITGGVVDKFGFNVAKFALSGYVPILGGYLSDGFDLISASVVIVKNAFGYFAAMTLVGIVVFPLLNVMVFSLTLRFTAAIVEPIGEERIAKLLHTLAENMNLLITALAGVGFLFFIMIMLIIGSCNMGV